MSRKPDPNPKVLKFLTPKQRERRRQKKISAACSWPDFRLPDRRPLLVPVVPFNKESATKYLQHVYPGCTLTFLIREKISGCDPGKEDVEYSIIIIHEKKEDMATSTSWTGVMQALTG